jgi:hypothetical protein
MFRSSCKLVDRARHPAYCGSSHLRVSGSASGDGFGSCHCQGVWGEGRRAGFFAFFGQRWLEDVNSKIDEANEALANMDIIQSEYMSEVEAAYYLNDNQFLDAKRTPANRS